MSNIKVILGNSFDLDSYGTKFGSEYFKEKYPQCNFLGYGWRNIAKEDPKKDNDANAGVRAKGTPIAHDSLGQSFLTDGWKGEYRPPIEDENGKLKDGRTRRDELIYLGESWMPVARLKFKASEKPKTQERASMIDMNNHDFHTRYEMLDFVTAVGRDIEDGECEVDEDAIRDHLVNEYKIENYYDMTSGGIVQKIINLIMKYAEGGDGNTPYSRENVTEWVSGCLYDINKDQIPSSVAILKTGGQRDEQLIMRWVLPQSPKKPEVILYPSGLFAEDARQSVLDFISDVKGHYKNVFKCVSGAIDHLNVKAPTEDCFDLIGIVPTLETEYQQRAWKENRLLTLREFLEN